MSFDCVLYFVITSKTKDRIIGYFSITYKEGDMEIASEDMQWSSAMGRFPPSLNEYCVEIDGEKVYPNRIKIFERIVSIEEYKNVTEDYINE